MYAAIAWVLRSSGDRIDAGSRSRRVLRLALVVASVVNAVFFGVVDPALWALGVDEPPAWLAAAVAPITLVFGLTFLLAFALGITLRRVPGQRRAALLLLSIGPVLALTVLVSVVGGPLAGFAHPTYTETVTNVGLALTGLAAVTRPSPAPDLAPAGRRGTGGLSPSPPSRVPRMTGAASYGAPPAGGHSARSKTSRAPTRPASTSSKASLTASSGRVS